MQTSGGLALLLAEIGVGLGSIWVIGEICGYSSKIRLPAVRQIFLSSRMIMEWELIFRVAHPFGCGASRPA
jgi:hypothetical protein